MGALAALALTLLPAGLAGQEALPDTTVPLSRRGCCLDQVSDGAQVKGLDIRGNDALDGSTIEAALYTTESGGLLWWKHEELFSKEEFLKDLERLHILYQRNGYFDAELVSYEVAPSGEGVDVSLTVSEGEPTRVDTLAIEGLDLLNGEELTDEMRDRIPLQQDEVFNEPDLVASRALLENEFQNRGYVYATVLLEYRIDKDERTASVTYSVDAGDQYYIGERRIEGYDPEDLDLIEGQLEFASGELYDRQDILDSQRNLYELGLFRRVLIEPQLASVRGDTVDVLVSVAPAPTHVVRVGVGYGTEDRIRLRASWLDRNLLGGARQLEVRGQYSQLEREAAITYRQPTMFVPELTFLSTAFLRFEIEPNYTVERVGATLRSNYRVGRRWQARIGVTSERDEFSEFDEGVLIPELGREFINPSRLLYADLGVSFDNTDSLFQPSRGSLINLSHQIGMPVLGGEYAYNKTTLLVTRHLEITEGWVLAGKILPGVIFGYGGENDRVPLFQRLFAGGANSVRGYERRQLGPKDDPAAFGQERDPEPVGGRALFETSVELRFPIRGSLSGAMFVDAGNVWSDPDEMAIGDLKYAPGAGIRYRTPVGPIRLDVARKTANDEDFLPKWVFHISIGSAF